MSYRGHQARVEFDTEDGVFVGHVLGVKDIVGFHARTMDDLKAAFHEAIDDYVDADGVHAREVANIDDIIS